VNYRVLGLSPDLFRPLFQLTDEELLQHGAVRRFADAPNSLPCRVSLVEAEIGEELLLLPHRHHSSHSPYQSSGPIYVRRQAAVMFDSVNEVPPMQLRRLSSIRGYDAAGYMLKADVVAGADLEQAILRFLEDSKMDYLHVHNARPGCYAFRVERAER
jgi:hypothetical protein